MSTYHERKLIKEEYKKWFNDKKWYYFVTFTYKSGVPMYIANKHFDIFLFNLNKFVFGRKSKRKMKIIPILEKTKSGNPHYHVLIEHQKRFHDEFLKWKIMSLWSKNRYTSFKGKWNNDWFKIIDNKTQINLIEYCLKDLQLDLDNINIKNLNI